MNTGNPASFKSLSQQQNKRNALISTNERIPMKLKSCKYKAFSFSLDEETAQALASYKRRIPLNNSAIVRLALMKYLTANENN